MKIKCPSCSKVLAIPETAAGKIVKCPCGKQLRAPGGAKPAAAKPAAQPKRPTPARPTPARPTPARPPAAQPAAPAASVGDMFDELTDEDLQPIKKVQRPGQKAPPKSNPNKVLEKYASADDKRASVLLGPRVDFEIAHPGRRIIAKLIDGFFVMIFVGIGIGIAIAVADPETEDLMSPFYMILLGAYLVPFIINAILISISGQTVGKKILGVRIVNETTGATSGFTQGFLIRTFGFNFITNLPIIGPFIAIADVVYLFLEEHRTLHDRWANTSVARVR